jgi:hypothetical protein
MRNLLDVFALPLLPLVLALGACAGDRVVADDDDKQPAETVDRVGETCTEFMAENTCGAQSVQYCSQIAGDLEWGPCLSETEMECEPGEAADCDGWGTQTCSLYGGVPFWNTDECDSGGGDTPLVLKFAGSEIEYAAASVHTFDISGRGGCLTTDWPSAATPWLAMDLDRNGIIEDGAELFGSGTILPDGTHARQGFEALSILDTNADGLITAADERFAELVTWADHDGDRVGTLDELTPVTSLALTAIQLGFASDARCDARGNCEIERAAFSYAGGSRSGEVVDVHLACQ